MLDNSNRNTIIIIRGELLGYTDSRVQRVINKGDSIGIAALNTKQFNLPSKTS